MQYKREKNQYQIRCKKKNETKKGDLGKTKFMQKKILTINIQYAGSVFILKALL